MALAGELGLELVVISRDVLIFDGLLALSSASSVLTCEYDFFLSCSMTAAYKRSISAWARSRSASMTFWSKELGELTTGLTGLLTTESSWPPRLKFLLNQDDEAERMDWGEAGVLLVGLAVTSSSSSVFGELSVLRLILLPTVRSRMPQISTVTT